LLPRYDFPDPYSERDLLANGAVHYADFRDGVARLEFQKPTNNLTAHVT
jgi:hypothetical protein